MGIFGITATQIIQIVLSGFAVVGAVIATVLTIEVSKTAVEQITKTLSQEVESAGAGKIPSDYEGPVFVDEEGQGYIYLNGVLTPIGMVSDEDLEGHDVEEF
ncbi:MAG: hypothetical protein QW575_07340 [Thermoproteota archaeon]